MLREEGSTCHEQFVACSTFKVPLALMAFDSGLLKDEHEVFKWDGEKRFLEIWNTDHNAATWMKDSVIWFSQRLTPKLGEAKVIEYLQKFSYGNKDISGGLTNAWLKGPFLKEPSLKISPYEQLEFLKALWKETLPVSPKAIALTKKIMFLETSPKGAKLSGKTGSNYYDEARMIRLGWFIAHIQKGEEEYLAVVNFSDSAPSQAKEFGGFSARKLLTDRLIAEDIW